MVVEYPPNCQPIQHTNNTSDLVKRLRALSEALQISDTNDEAKTPDRYRDLAAHLASRTFLDSNSNDVQIWLACCLADVFRIFSPQVPFGDPAQLRDVLIFMTRSLKGLDSPGGSLFRRYFYLLENISACNTLHLALELPGEESCIVIKYLIKCTMDIVNGKEWARERESSEELDDAESMDTEGEDKNDRKERMQQLLLNSITKLIGEVDQITIPVLDAIFFYLINPQKSNYRESYAMARTIIQNANTSLDVPVENLLTRSLLAGSFLPECEMVGSNRQKLYEVIIELYEALPSLVVPVIPQIGHFLKDTDAESRLAAVKAVGVMVQNPKSRLYEDYPDVWAAYLERRRDMNAKIRSTFAKNALPILLNNSQLRGPVCEAVCRLLKDPADEVRLDAFHTAFEAARRKLDSVNEDLITACCEKMFDSKANIRQEVISKLLQLHSKVINGEEYTVSDRQVVSVIPAYAFRLYRSPDADKEDKVKVERLLSAFIIPYKMDTEKRIKWMVELHEKLGRMESDVLVSIFLRNAAYRRLTREILFAIKGEGETERKQKEIENRIERIAKEQPVRIQFAHVLRKLTNLLTEDNKVFESLYHTVGSDYTCAKVADAVAAFITSLAEAKTKFSKDEQTMLRHFVERLAPLILDKDGAEVLAQCVIRADGDFTCQKADSENRLAKMLLLFKNLADAYPHVFTNSNVIEKLLKLLRSDNAKTVEATLSVFLFVGSQQKTKEEPAEWFNDVTAAVWGLVSTEQPGFGRVAKLAVRVLCKLEKKEDLVGAEGKFLQVAEDLEQRLDIDNPACVNALRALSAMHRASPDAFAQKFAELSTTVIVPLILSADVAVDDPKTLDLAVEEFHRLKVPKYTYVKVYAMKLLSRSLTGHADVDQLALKTMKMFASFIQSNGNIHAEEAEICPVECALMRAVAGSCILRLSYYPKYLKMMTTDQFVVLSRLMTDSAECVRRYFSDRLYKGIQRNKLVVEFIALFALPSLLRNGAEGDEVIHKYLEECRTRLKMGILRRAQMIRCCNIPPGNAPFFQPEYSIAYSIFLLAIQPILTSHKDTENLAFLQECIWFLMDAFVQNYTLFDFELMYRSLQEVRQSTSIWAIERANEGEMTRKDVEALNKKMWALADLALCMLVYRAKISIKNVPGDTQLVKFFKKMKETNDPIYAPQELIEAEEKRHGKVPTEKKRGMNGTTTTSRAGKTKATARAPSKKKKKVEVIEEDDEEEDEIEESDEEEVMPAPSKRRGLSVRNSAPSTSNGSSPNTSNRRSDAKSDSNVASGSPKKSPKKPSTQLDSPKSLKKRSHAAMVASTSGSSNGLPEPLDKKTRLSLEDLPFSPIVKDGSMIKRTINFQKGLVTSTPLSKPTGNARARKLTIEDALPEEDEEEMEVEEPKKSSATRSRRGAVSEAPKSSPKKKQESKQKEKRPSRGGARGRVSSPPKEEEDEEMEEEEPVRKAVASKRGKKTSAGGKKEEEEEKEDQDEDEPMVEKKATRRSGKKSDVVEKKAPPARKSAGKDAKNKKTEKEEGSEGEEEEEKEEEVKQPAKRASARKSNASPAMKKAPAKKSASEESEKGDDEEEEVEEKEATGKRASRSSAASKKAAAKKTEEKEDEDEEGEEDEEEEKKETSKKAKAAPAAKKAPAKKNEPKAPAARASRRQAAQPSSSAASSPAKSTATRSSRRKK